MYGTSHTDPSRGMSYPFFYDNTWRCRREFSLCIDLFGYGYTVVRTDAAKPDDVWLTADMRDWIYWAPPVLVMRHK